MNNEHLFPTAAEFLSAFANLIHVCSREKQIAAAVFKRNVQTFNKRLTEGGKTWIEAPKDAPDIIQVPAWFLVAYQKMRDATRTNGFETLSPEELSMLTGFAPNGNFPFAPMFQFSTNYCVRPYAP